MKVNENNDFVVTRLKDGVFNVIEQNLDLLTTNGRVEEAVRVCLESSRCALLCSARTQVQILEPRIVFVVRQYQTILFYHTLFCEAANCLVRFSLLFLVLGFRK